MAIAGKINVTMGVTTVDLHVGAQTVRLRIEDAQELARKLADTAAGLRAKIWPQGKPKA
jgi:hypothetical protein